ncbi:Hypothetical predicted protein [Podarcis lilfordi]|uniref:Uncharacterized protein n=1 Tax=Podarcis lilfordi TaxID=74358 RepID=A0AA35KB80_9SAUR|nr:Hypothetical predicted protein [Podarcis lilfordi]
MVLAPCWARGRHLRRGTKGGQKRKWCWRHAGPGGAILGEAKGQPEAEMVLAPCWARGRHLRRGTKGGQKRKWCWRHAGPEDAILEEAQTAAGSGNGLSPKAPS